MDHLNFKEVYISKDLKDNFNYNFDYSNSTIHLEEYIISCLDSNVARLIIIRVEEQNKVVMDTL